MSGVVVLGSPPRCGYVGHHVACFVHEKDPPALTGANGERPAARLAACLVSEDQGPVVVPAEGVGANEAPAPW
jgi:hypothetical protein